MENYNSLKDNSIYINPGAFDNYGGWVLDTQFYSLLRSEYLLAHGIGTPVENAKTRFSVPKDGQYKIWIRTKNWVEQWKKDAAPGVFKVKINGEYLNEVFGKHGDWNWQDGGVLNLKGECEIELCDLTGFEGRCAGILVTGDMDFVPSSEPSEIENMIASIKGDDIEEMGVNYDMVVCGGGIAGICTALSSARNGLKTAFIQDRFVVGGNNSSEVRVWLGGKTNFEPYPKIGNIVSELEQEKMCGYGEGNTAEIYEDDKKLSLLEKEPNIDIYMGSIVADTFTEDDNVKAVKIYNVIDGTFRVINGKLFTDATGDGDAAYYAGADFEMTTNGHMGMTNMWNVRETDTEQTFPDCSDWAIDLTNCEFPGRGNTKSIYGQLREQALGGWYWESGMELDPIKYAEYARDLNLRAMYSAWHTVKNIDNDYKCHVINHSSYIGGKRESRRFLGDVILTKCDVHKKIEFPDRCVPSTWDFDVHYPDSRFYAAFSEGDGFLSKDCHEKFEYPYFIPYRCLYSRNINNLYLAGRNISVTHDALGSVRVMRTGGMMGEVIGKAAALCKKYDCSPRDVYAEHLEELIKMFDE